MGVSPCGGGRVAFHVHRQVVRRQPGPAFPFYADMGRAAAPPPWKGSRRESALWATRPEGGQADRGTGGCGSIRHPYPRSKGPRPKGGVDPEAALAVVGSRAVGCADHARASGRDAPPYALLHFGADFSMLCRKHALCQGALGIPMAHLSLFQWAIGGPRGPHTPGTVVALRGRWPTGRGPCVTRGPHILTALLAPSGRSTRPLCTV